MSVCHALLGCWLTCFVVGGEVGVAVKIELGVQHSEITQRSFLQIAGGVKPEGSGRGVTQFSASGARTYEKRTSRSERHGLISCCRPEEISNCSDNQTHVRAHCLLAILHILRAEC